MDYFHEADQAFLVKAKDWCRQAVYDTRPRLTPFLNAHEQRVLEAYTKKISDLSLAWDGGFANGERRRARLMPAWMEGLEAETAVTGFLLHPVGTKDIPDHSQILGALMGLGIDRSVVGDILVSPQTSEVYLAVSREMAPFILENFNQAGSTWIRLEPADLTKVEKHEAFDELLYPVSSMRLDVIAAAVMQVSRSQVADALKGGNIQVNHTVEKNPSRTCRLGDTLSIRRWGRFKLVEEARTTRSGKTVLKIHRSI